MWEEWRKEKLLEREREISKEKGKGRSFGKEEGLPMKGKKSA